MAGFGGGVSECSCRLWVRSILRGETALYTRLLRGAGDWDTYVLLGCVVTFAAVYFFARTFIAASNILAFPSALFSIELISLPFLEPLPCNVCDFSISD